MMDTPEMSKRFDVLLDTYNSMWENRESEDYSGIRSANRELMRLCRLPGVYSLGNSAFVEIRGHDPADPLPSGVYGVFPVDSSDNGCPFAQEALPAGCAFRDDADEISYYYPWAENDDGRAHKIKVYIWDKQENKAHEREISTSLTDKYISRVISVSSQGTFLLLELRSCTEDIFDVVCLSVNGRFMADVFHGWGDAELEAVFLEDGRYAPNRGYLWLPYTRHVICFEQEYDTFYTDLKPPALEHISGAIETIHYSIDGESLTVITCESDGPGKNDTERTLYIYRNESGEWDSYPFGRVRKILTSRDHRFILTCRVSLRDPDTLVWSLFPGIMKNKQKPLAEFRESRSDSRIVLLSYDLCSLLDDRGVQVYDICWQYKKGKNS